MLRTFLRSRGKYLYMNHSLSIAEFNPNLGDVTRATRVAYVKFMRKKMAADEVSIADEGGATNGEAQKKPLDAAGVLKYMTLPI